jgi:hypothetical protein
MSLFRRTSKDFSAFLVGYTFYNYVYSAENPDTQGKLKLQSSISDPQRTGFLPAQYNSCTKVCLQNASVFF